MRYGIAFAMLCLWIWPTTLSAQDTPSQTLTPATNASPDLLGALFDNPSASVPSEGEQRLADLERVLPEQVQALAQEHGKDEPNPDKIAQEQEKLKAIVTELIDLRDESQQRELEQLQSDLERIRQDIATRRKNRDQRIAAEFESHIKAAAEAPGQAPTFTDVAVPTSQSTSSGTSSSSLRPAAGALPPASDAHVDAYANPFGEAASTPAAVNVPGASADATPSQTRPGNYFSEELTVQAIVNAWLDSKQKQAELLSQRREVERGLQQLQREKAARKEEAAKLIAEPDGRREAERLMNAAKSFDDGLRAIEIQLEAITLQLVRREAALAFYAKAIAAKYQQAISRAKAAQVSLEVAQAELERGDVLYRQGTIPVAEVDRMRAQVSQAEANVAVAKEAVTIAKAAVDLITNEE